METKLTDMSHPAPDLDHPGCVGVEVYIRLPDGREVSGSVLMHPAPRDPYRLEMYGVGVDCWAESGLVSEVGREALEALEAEILAGALAHWDGTVSPPEPRDE